MKFTESLKKTSQFRRVYRRNNSAANRYLVLYVLPNHTNQNQIGISVSKKVGKSVIRSRVTRLIRENYRLSEDRIKRGYDLVFVARTHAADAGLREIRSAMLSLLRRQRLLIQDEGESS